MTHTPGPWFVGAMNDALFIIDRKPDHSIDSGVREGGITLVIAAVSMLKHPIADANARLIAAAPELLEACKAAQSALRAIGHTLEYVHPDDAKTATDAWKKIDAAIQKAEGAE